MKMVEKVLFPVSFAVVLLFSLSVCHAPCASQEVDTIWTLDVPYSSCCFPLSSLPVNLGRDSFDIPAIERSPPRTIDIPSAWGAHRSKPPVTAVRSFWFCFRLSVCTRSILLPCNLHRALRSCVVTPQGRVTLRFLFATMSVVLMVFGSFSWRLAQACWTVAEWFRKNGKCIALTVFSIVGGGTSTPDIIKSSQALNTLPTFSHRKPYWTFKHTVDLLMHSMFPVTIDCSLFQIELPWCRQGHKDNPLLKKNQIFLCNTKCVRPFVVPK